MTAPGRPIQNLLGVIQFGEQMNLQRQSEERARRTSAANIIQQFMTMAPNQNPQDRGALAGLLAREAGVDPSTLMQAVNARPVSAATTGDAAAAANFGMMEGVYPRMREAIEQIPDTTIRDMALGNVAQTFTGQPAGTARIQGAMADPTKTPEVEIGNAVNRQLGSMLTAPQVVEFEQSAERLRQGWTQLADAKVSNAVDQSLRRAQLQWQMRVSEATARGENTKGFEAENPAKVMTELFEMTKELTSKPQTKEARGMMGWMIRGQYERAIAALGGRQNIDPEVLKTMDEAFSPDKIVNAPPTYWTGFFSKKIGGGK